MLVVVEVDEGVLLLMGEERSELCSCGLYLHVNSTDDLSGILVRTENDEAPKVTSTTHL